MHTRRAFTTVELLIVVAMLAVLASIMVPMLHRVQRTNRINLCLMNQRALSLANTQYALDNNMHLTSARTDVLQSPDNPDVQVSPHCWVKAEGANLVLFQERASSLEQGALFPYVGSLKFYVSPNEPNNVRTQALGLGDTRVRSYSFNAFLGCRSLNEYEAQMSMLLGYRPDTRINPRALKHDQSRLTMVKHPGKMMSTIIEDNEASYNYSGWWVCPVHPVWFHWPARWDTQAITLSFVDGSFETHAMRDTEPQRFWYSIPHEPTPAPSDANGGLQPVGPVWEYDWLDPRLPDWRYFRDRMLPGSFEPSPGAFEHDND